MIKLNPTSSAMRALSRAGLVLSLTMAFAVTTACSDDEKAEPAADGDAEAPAEEEAPKDKYAMAAEKEVTAENADKIADELEKQLKEELEEVESEEAAK